MKSQLDSGGFGIHLKEKCYKTLSGNLYAGSGASAGDALPMTTRKRLTFFAVNYVSSAHNVS
jgi:hypothetical protein